ncbi:Nitrilase/cyanide hydratase and apolipoprotein N-acyltransferase [Ruegeria sp. TM1040]|uniref:carbon-nitrogen hydrolase family protein n=1 Tax=Ruegeria sp. (strain TM1040) TaxID=292414 RepID=UPI0000462A2A|nr:carbon-nitrogen hydrolase family protein [Ruegeria sp. TM1040]ABF65636.1 Nitrilase/cyanide hydratase and apolipoprotein N-acyltransferase [Ruegeria sp. TM1040]
MVRIALLQMTSSDLPEENLAAAREMIARTAAAGAQFVLTPEVTNCLSTSRTQQQAVLHPEENDPTLAGLRDAARQHGVWLSIGSLGVKTTDADGRFANRQFLISPDGEIKARYDKIHMFDVEVTPEETYRESDGYRPGTRAVLADAGFAKIGMTICYDVRFPALHRRLAQAGAEIITAPAAFSHVTGAAHWHSLLRARAIETGCFVLAAAQTGVHDTSRGAARQTYGHSLAVAPWGEILADAGTETGITCVDLDLEAVKKARKRVPSLTHDREFDGP